MDSNHVWTLVDPPKGVKPVGCKWVYKRKLGADREVTAFKARLVVEGYTQQPGIDFDETYSPVAMAKSIRILLAIATCRRVSLPLEKIRRSVVSKGPSMASSKFFKAGTHILMKLYGAMSSSKNKFDPSVCKKISGSMIAYLVLVRIDDQKANWIDDFGNHLAIFMNELSYGSLRGLIGMTRIPSSDSIGLVLRLEKLWQSHAYDSSILDLARDDCVFDMVIISLVQYSQKFQDKIRPLSVYDSYVSYEI
ncbi:UNVERIFIED_CONTAM: Retrovirus-related Pol polyprotein from transposon TNT 1-94 [Sesamum calycinum]|uniref:Retrovirus-related Pol polyprotein from transposon TNT 1-94 n=1 Tax=Sesamum calycinum TaxID=2727403 RepID=A0AAW2M9P8_9LAMI